MSVPVVDHLETIAHLDFEPACDSLLHGDNGPLADWIVFTLPPPCRCVSTIRTWCTPCLSMAQGQRNSNLKCVQCGNVWHTFGWIIRAEPIR